MLSDRIKECFDRSVSSEFSGLSEEHPIIILNVLKNIIGDNREEYSKKLLEFMERKSKEFPKREDDQSILDETAKEGLGLTVFVSDLEDACQEGIPSKIEKEAAKLQWVSENGLGGFEALIEVALQDFNRLGAFSFHLFRSNIFNFKWNPSSSQNNDRYSKKPIKDESSGMPSEFSRMTGLSFSVFFDLDAPKKKK